MALLNFKYQPCDSKNTSVRTPPALFDQLNSEFHFDFDPCPFEYASKKLAGEDLIPNGLTCSWGLRNWVNPPFNEIKQWAEKAVEESYKGKLTVMLVPFRANSKYWEDIIHPNHDEYRVIAGKVKFEGYEQGYPQCMVIVVIKPKVKV